MMLIFAFFAAAFGGAAFMGGLDAHMEFGRPEPRLDHDCDVYSGAYGETAERVRCTGLEAADRELTAAAERIHADWLVGRC